MEYLNRGQIDSDVSNDEITFRNHTADMGKYGGVYLTISYKYISIFCDKSGFCFDNQNIRADQFIKYFEKITDICHSTYDSLIDADYTDDIRFHEMDYKGPRKVLKERFLRIINDIHEEEDDIDESEDMPQLYQFSVYTDSDNGEAPRIIGFIAGDGIFFPVFFDLEHNAFPQR